MNNIITSHEHYMRNIPAFYTFSFNRSDLTKITRKSPDKDIVSASKDEDDIYSSTSFSARLLSNPPLFL
jgi:hypothetical protein